MNEGERPAEEIALIEDLVFGGEQIVPQGTDEMWDLDIYRYVDQGEDPLFDMNRLTTPSGIHSANFRGVARMNPDGSLVLMTTSDIQNPGHPMTGQGEREAITFRDVLPPEDWAGDQMVFELHFSARRITRGDQVFPVPTEARPALEEFQPVSKNEDDDLPF